ncbi:MAG: YraN family protein [Gammaproteobacteria bacterium]|nr:YraN family protein [Gammaproteobacteria bacterium]
MPSHITRGRRAERRAERFLRRRGLATVMRNYARTTGEVDLVMLDGDDLVCVEVRYRGPGSWVSAVESVDHAKQRRIARTSELFRRDHPEHRFRAVRFDVVAATKGNLGLDLEWIRNAFDATECA